jgi:phospholipase/carboxylesterase
VSKLSGPMLPPRDGGAPKQVAVLLHGYGSDGADLIGLAPYWRDVLPGALFVTPNAPEPCRDNPGGYQWFPIDSARPEFRADGAAKARPILAEFLADLWTQTSLAAKDTILVGFSQGAMMALHLGLGLSPPPMGIISFSGALIPPDGVLDRVGSKPPICLIHGDRDGVVDPAFSAEAFALLQSKGFPVRYHVEAGAAHTITEDGLGFAGDFIGEITAAPGTHAATLSK